MCFLKTIILKKDMWSIITQCLYFVVVSDSMIKLTLNEIRVIEN